MAQCESIGLEVDDVFFSRCNFMYPQFQPVLHCNFENEVDYLNGYFNGKSVVLGTRDRARWHCYTKNGENGLNTIRSSEFSQSLEMVLFDLDPDAMKYYFRDFRRCHNSDKSDQNAFDIDGHVMTGCGIPDNAIVDTHCFDPCGYSLNGIFGGKYWSIHITPEPEGSFVSFETDFIGDCGYRETVEKVVRLFGPKRFSVAVNRFGDDVGVKRRDWRFDGFVKRDCSSHCFSERHSIWWCSYHVMQCGEMGHTKSVWKYVQHQLTRHKLSMSTWKEGKGGDCGVDEVDGQRMDSLDSPLSECSVNELDAVSSTSDSDDPPSPSFDGVN